MKIIIKRVLMLLAVVIITMGGSGCMVLRLNSDWHKAEILRYLEDKYDEKFVINKVKDASWAYNFKTAYCSPADHPEEEFEVRRSKDGLFYHNSDGYILHLMNRQLRAYIEDITKGQWEDFKISTSVTTLNKVSAVEYTKGITLKDYILRDYTNDAFYNVGIYINVKSLDKNDAVAMDVYFRGEPEKAYGIHKKVIGDGYISSLILVYLNSDDYLNVELANRPVDEIEDFNSENIVLKEVVVGYPEQNTIEELKTIQGYYREENNE